MEKRLSPPGRARVATHAQTVSLRLVTSDQLISHILVSMRPAILRPRTGSAVMKDFLAPMNRVPTGIVRAALGILVIACIGEFWSVRSWATLSTLLYWSEY